MACEHKKAKLVRAGEGWRILCEECTLQGKIGFDPESAARMWTEQTGCDAPSGEFDPEELVQGLMGMMKGGEERASAILRTYKDLAWNLGQVAIGMKLNAIARVVAAGKPIEDLVKAERAYATAATEAAMEMLTKMVEKEKP